MQTDTASFCPVPEGRHHDHYACKQREFPRKHKNTKTFEAGFNTKSKSYAPQPATLAGQEETPRWLSSIPKCLQSRNCCPAQKFPQKSTAPTHGTEWAPKPLHRMNKRMNVSSSEARTQSAKQCLWVNPGSSIKHFYTCFSQILTPPQQGVCPTHCSPKGKAQHLESCCSPTSLSWQRLPHQATLSVSFQWLLWIPNNSAL